MGTGCLRVLFVSAVVEFWTLVGGLPGAIGTRFGWVIVGKSLLLAILLVYATVNRYRLAPALLGDADGDRTKGADRRGGAEVARRAKRYLAYLHSHQDVHGQTPPPKHRIN